MMQIERLGARNIIIRSQKPPQADQQGQSNQSFTSKFGLTRTDLGVIEEMFPHATAIVPLKELGSQVLRGDKRKTSQAFGTTPDMFEVAQLKLERGRYLTQADLDARAMVCVIGSEIAKEFFHLEDPVGETLRIDEKTFKVIGVLEAKGSSMNQSEDRRVLIPLQTGKRYYGADRSNYSIMVSVNDPTQIEAAIGEATVVLRNVRGLSAADDNDFEISKSDGLIDIIKENTTYLRLAAVSIGFITLLGAAIGLMNIMLVTVTERTREIGIRKALGATSRAILTQFLVEAVVISLMGGVLGIFLGVLVGNVVSVLFGSDFLFPWLWISVALVTCTFVGLLSGLYPAMRAAQLDPIESLRYE